MLFFHFQNNDVHYHFLLSLIFSNDYSKWHCIKNTAKLLLKSYPITLYLNIIFNILITIEIDIFINVVLHLYTSWINSIKVIRGNNPT